LIPIEVDLRLSGLAGSFRPRHFRKARILKSVESVLKSRNISHLTQEAYEFITSYCGSAPHYNINSWKRAYKDIRDLLNLFLKGNEYGVNLEKAVINRENWEKELFEEFATIRGIVELCRTHRREVFSVLDAQERRQKEKIARGLLRGTISLKAILGGSTPTTTTSSRCLAHYAMAAHGSSSIRELVEELNQLMDVMDIVGVKELVRKYPMEVVVAGNYVNAKVRYVVQSIIATEVGQLKQEKKEQS
jgi:hypothetical protein